MNKKNIALLFLLFSALLVVSQQKKYGTYTVKEGETMRDIAKDFDLSTRDLLKLNPDIGRRPEANTIIIVPNKNFGQPNLTPTIPVVLKDTVNFIYYTVVKDDTVYNLKKRFGVSDEQLIENNNSFKLGVENGSELKDLLKLGMEIKFPKRNNEIDKFTYTVVKDDTVYSLTRRFHISVEELLKLNPDLKDGLKLGMVLQLKKGTIEKVITKPIKNNVDTKVVEKWGGTFKEKLDYNKEISIVLLLPYELNKLNDSLRNDGFLKKNSLLNIATDFHMGAQMAIDSIKQKGLRVNVKYLDSQNSNYRLQQLVNRNEFKNTDVVIGPLFFDSAQWLASHINVPVVSPVYSKKQTDFSHPNLIKSSPNVELLENRIISYFKKHYKNQNIVIINDGLDNSKSALWRIVNKIKAIPGVQNVEVIKPEKSFISTAIIGNSLKYNRENWLLLVGDDNVTTAATVNGLKNYFDKLDLTLFALNNGANFDQIDNNLLGSLKFTFPSVDYLYIDDENTNLFYQKYLGKNNALPSKFAVRGFDVTYDVLVRIASNNNLFDGLKAGKSTRISSMFNYSKFDTSFENNEIFLIQFSKELVPLVIQ